MYIGNIRNTNLRFKIYSWYLSKNMGEWHGGIAEWPYKEFLPHGG